MSVLYLMNDPGWHTPASQRIPVMARPFVSDRAKKALNAVELFVEEECIPADAVFAAQVKAAGDAFPSNNVMGRFGIHQPILEDLKKRAKELGLWNLFLPKAHFGGGAGFSNLEYGLIAELLGKSVVGSEARVFTGRSIMFNSVGNDTHAAQSLMTTVPCTKMVKISC